MILGISQRKLLIAIIIQSETPALSKAAHSESDIKDNTYAHLLWVSPDTC